MARKNLEGYPTSWGNTHVSIFVHHGPPSYVRRGADGAFATDGDVVLASEAGLKAFDALIVLGGWSTPVTAGHIVQAFIPNGNTPGAGTGAVSATTAILRWSSPDTGNEITAETDLSGSSVRLLAIGPK